MTLRTIPALSSPPANCSPHLSERAVSTWSPMQSVQTDGEAVISILDVIGYDWWFDSGVTSKRISAALRSIGDKPVTVQINSPGGDFFEGVAIYNMLRMHPAKVTVQILGIAASAASVIAMAGDEIQIAKLGFMMIHNTQWIAVGDRHVMQETHDIMSVFDTACAEMYAERSGETVDALVKMLDAETWMAGQAVVDKGFADIVQDFETVARENIENSSPALYRLEAALAAGRPLPRSERRKLLKEISTGTPGAVSGGVTPSAGAPEVEGFDHLRLAAARLSLLRA